MVQVHEMELARVRAEMRKLRETENQKIQQLEEERQTLEKAARRSDEQLQILIDEKVGGKS